MTEVYGGTRLLAPVQYGLTVVDFKTNTILDMNGYTSFHRMLLSSFGDEDEYNCALGLAKNDRVAAIDKRFFVENEWAVGKPAKFIVEEFVRLARAGKTHSLADLSIDTKPFKVKKYKESLDGTRQMKKDVLALGFTLTSEDEAQWEAYESNYLEE